MTSMPDGNAGTNGNDGNVVSVSTATAGGDRVRIQPTPSHAAAQVNTKHSWLRAPQSPFLQVIHVTLLPVRIFHTPALNPRSTCETR
jgi:hypothetical protein